MVLKQEKGLELGYHLQGVFVNMSEGTEGRAVVIISIDNIHSVEPYLSKSSKLGDTGHLIYFRGDPGL